MLYDEEDLRDELLARPDIMDMLTQQEMLWMILEKKRAAMATTPQEAAVDRYLHDQQVRIDELKGKLGQDIWADKDVQLALQKQPPGVVDAFISSIAFKIPLQDRIRQLESQVLAYQQRQKDMEDGIAGLCTDLSAQRSQLVAIKDRIKRQSDAIMSKSDDHM